MIFDTERVFQFCPECVATTGERDPDCWRCDGEGTVEPFDPLASRYKLRTYLCDMNGTEPISRARVRVSLKTLPPEVEL